MAKRHTKQTSKQKLGQFFTTNSDYILSGFEFVVNGKCVIDPFAGNGDLLSWAEKNGAIQTIGYDLVPRKDTIIKNDSIRNPPSYTNKVLVSNPPYLSKNKYKEDKSIFDKWNQNDLYKCHLASLKKDCEEAIVIIPSNFFCESNSRIRKTLFETHYIVSAKYWNTPVFEDATTGVTVIHLKSGSKEKQDFQLHHISDNKSFQMILEEKYNFLHGKNFFDRISIAKNNIRIIKTDVGMKRANTNIVVGLLDNGKWESGLSMNYGEPLYCSPKSFTTYQITLPDYDLNLETQQEIVERFNNILAKYRVEYNDMFLSNYMGPKQKILSRSYVNKLIECVMMEMGVIKKCALTEFFA